jgi:methionyl-tRNA formyltransferase
VHRSWSLEILRGLLDIQDKKDWKITLIIHAEGEEIQKFSGIETLEINPKELGKYEEIIRKHSPMVIPTYGWSWIILKNILAIAPCLVLHPSKLPKYRGGSPIQNQLIEGVTESAVSIIYAEDKVDSGEILAQEKISYEGYLSDIFSRMAKTGLKLSIRLFDDMAKGIHKSTLQDESQATYVKRRTPQMSEITKEELSTKSAKYLYNKIRGLQEPYPEAYILCADGKKLFITKVHPEE